ncbi:DUF1850 domain-containing protein [Testudinibacter sp. P80/BLE/0925]|uniref:DUF1850 domain-containing protein n=1 Tax=Testudinibacter sp. TW-1 TaxID=3417757 RepID=UPI003D3615C0
MTKTGKWLLGSVLLTALACLFPLKLFVIQFGEHRCYLYAQQFELRWRHSVERQLWREHYRRDGDAILLDQTWLQTFGAGTPSQGTPIAAPPGYVGYRQRIRLAEINWVVSRNMQGELSTPQVRIPFYQVVPDYSDVRIKPSRTALMVFLWEKSCHDWAS